MANRLEPEQETQFLLYNELLDYTDYTEEQVSSGGIPLILNEWRKGD
jgi:hypothetical protein